MKKLLFLLLALTTLLCANAFATDGDIYNDGYWRIESDGDMQPVTNSGADIGSSSYNVATIYADDLILSSGQQKAVELPLCEFLIQELTTITPITTSTSPGLEIDNLIPSIVWADNEVTPVTVTFAVPPDYYSGGAFRLFCDSSASTTPVQVDFYVYKNKTATTWDAAATDQTPVALAQAAGTPENVTLSVATDFSALAAGDKVTLVVWRDNTTASTATGDLELYYAEFYYTAKR